MNKNDNKYATRIINAFLKNKTISPLPTKYTKKISDAQKFRKLCERKIKKPIEDIIPREKKPSKRLLIIVSAAIILGIIAYSLNWITHR